MERRKVILPSEKNGILPSLISVFIRSAKTLNILEEKRSQVVNILAIFLQKHWRGTLQRIRYKKMLALLKIMEHYRKYKLRSYINDLERKFKNVRRMDDRGKTIR